MPSPMPCSVLPPVPRRSTPLGSARAYQGVHPRAWSDAAIEAAGGEDLHILGIGVNGHIAFNKPGDPIDTMTHVVELTQNTREVNARFFESLDDVPTHAVTMGIKSIMHARKLILIALGEAKADAIKAAVEGRVDPACPASVLQLHPDVTFFCDEGAASKLTL